MHNKEYQNIQLYLINKIDNNCNFVTHFSIYLKNELQNN